MEFLFCFFVLAALAILIFPFILSGRISREEEKRGEQ